MAALVVAASLATIGHQVRSAAADPLVAGSAGTNTALPKDPASFVTVNGTGAFKNVVFTVNQTKNLVNQAISVTWTGATPPANPSRPFADHFMQILQCWGDDGGATNPGPPPTQCEYGGASSAPNGGIPTGIGTNTGTRFLGTFQGPAGQVPFKAVDGTVIPKAFGAPPNADQFHQSVWLNPYFDLTNTNEDDWAKVFPNGSGSEQFQVDTGLEAPGLGCGQSTQTVSGGGRVIPKCWLVIVPRGDVKTENGPDSSSQAVDTSPLSPTAWPNRTVVPLVFNPVDSQCAIGADQVRLVGSELASSAIGSWQPILCSMAGSPPYSFAPVADRLARQQLVTGTSGMAVLSRPLGPATTPSPTPVTYAPLTVSGVTVAFNVQRILSQKSISPAEATAEQPFVGSKVATINLTPLLVAKLLTESYRGQLEIVGAFPANYPWALSNPNDLLGDEDFLRFNPEFRDLAPGNFKTISGAIVEETSSDSAYELWRWILADPEAKAWLGGGPDGNSPPMKINPVYSLSSGFGTPVPDNFPKNDPYCYHDTMDLVGQPPRNPRPLCVLDWLPYSNSMQTAAQQTGAANDGAKATPGTVTPDVTADTFWVSDGAELRGSQSVLSITDTASAARYGLQMANLSRAGDDGASRTFVAPDPAGLAAGEKAMTASSDPAVSETNPSTTAAGAYPLTMVTYAAVTPSTLPAATRSAYAALITYAAGAGQTSGLQFGQLPPGYTPLSASLRAAGAAAATAIKNYAAPAATTSTTAKPQTSGRGTVTTVRRPSTTSPVTSSPGVAAGAPAAAVSPKGPSLLPAPVRKILRTLAQGIGLIRYTLPATVGVGAIAALGIGLLEADRRRAKPAPVSNSSPPAAGPAPPPGHAPNELVPGDVASATLGSNQGE